MLAQVACEMRMHSAWKADFDALQFTNTKLDSDVLSNMGSHLSYLQECKALPEATLDQLSECFICPKKKVSQASLMATLCLFASESYCTLQDNRTPCSSTYELNKIAAMLWGHEMLQCSHFKQQSSPFTRFMPSVSVHVGNGSVC